ncbi:MAG: phosphate-starvation-inducible PsiE family protein [Gemmatimonadales bacterium]
MAKRLPGNWFDIRRHWSELTTYQRFEAVVASALTAVIGVVILIALYRLIFSVIDTLLLRALNPLEPGVFQFVFGEIMTLLIALEFNHTVQYVISPGRGIIQVRAVILIALLAVVRKVIVVDPYETGPASVAALAALVLCLGVGYWLVRERDTRRKRSSPAGRTVAHGAA